MSDFELERFERSGDRLVVSGRWSGVRGMRFMRPTLTVGERRVLAVLDHKPWAPAEGEEWIAAFPWSGGDVDPAEAELAVSPSLVVPVAGGSLAEPVDPAAPEPGVREAERSARQDAEVSFLREQIGVLTERLGERESERDEARAELAAARDEAAAERDRLAATRDDLAGAAEETAARRAELAAERDRAAALEEELDAARAELDAIPRGVALVSAAEKPPHHPDRARLAAERELRATARRRPAGRTAEGASALDVWVPRVIASVAGVCMLLLLIGLLRIL